jgi:hypothetical protein
MSGQVLHFTPNAELGPQANLAAFIALCRQSEVLRAIEQFDENTWDVGYQKGQNKVLRVIYSTHEAAAQDKSEPALPQPFLDFAKAVLVYLQDTQPVVSQGPRIAALRYLEAALRGMNKGGRPTAVNPEVLDRAVELAKTSVSAGVAYRIAGQLGLIAKFMAAKGFIGLRQPWRPRMKKPQEYGSRISKEAIQARQEKLPSAAALRAIGGIFHEAINPVDVLVSSYTALMVCAPERINEVLRLRRNCLVPGEHRFVGKIGMRWPGSKGFEDTTKWFPTQMGPIAKDAVERLLAVTNEGYKLAVWYSDNPTTMYYHAGVVHLRHRDVLSLAEVAQVLWGDAGGRVAANVWARSKGLEAVPLDKRRIGYLRADVERAVLDMLPATFPHMPGDDELLCRDALAVTRTNELHAERATYLCMFDCVDHGTIDNRLGVPGKESIFDRFTFTEDDGTRIGLNSHSLRHYLNMLAQMGGLSSAEIAIFSGRKDVQQNRAYDHMSSAEVQAPISAALKAGFTTALVPAGSRTITTRSEFKGVGVVAAHTTDFGWCMHNFAAEPCQMYRDCINCEEQECIKGDAQKEENLRLLKSETEYLLEQARQALSDEEYGADNWVKHQTTTLQRACALLDVMADPKVAPGARIRLDRVVNAPLLTNQAPALPINTRRVRKALK